MSTNYNPAIVTDNLTLCVDAANPKSYPGSGTTWKDLSGRGNDGTNGTGNNAASFENTEPKCFNFDQSQSRIFGTPLFPQNGCPNAGTIEVWYQHNQSTHSQVGMLYFEGNGNGFGIEREIHLGQMVNGTVDFFIEGADADIRIISDDVIPANTWTCATSTFTGLTQDSTKSAKLYINGSFKKSQVTSANFRNGTITNSIIGRARTQINGVWRKLVGKIAVVKVYSKQLSDSEVLQNYHALKGRFGI
tara:strand:- start:86 stop:826 length:741 start_codon:yes stop_codon:yes gene_type:complete